MPSVNNGPALTQTSNTEATMTPVSTNQLPVPVGMGALRLIAVYQNMPLSGLGDIQLPVINAARWAPVSIAFTNALVNGVSASVAAANLGVFSGPAATGTTIRTAGVLTGQTTQPVFTTAGVAAGAAALQFTGQTIYVNLTVAVAGGTVDVYIYGYDVSIVS